MASGVFEDEEEVSGRDARFGGAVVGADVIGGEVAEVFDEDFLGEGEEAEVGLELVVGGWGFEGAAVEPVDEELEGGVVVFGEVELFGFAFDEVALKGRFEVVGAIAEEIFMEAKDLALGSDEDVDHVGVQEAVPCQLRLGSQRHTMEYVRA